MTSNPEGLTDAELAAQAGVNLDRVHRLAELGVVEASKTDGTFRPIDIQRVRIAEAFADSGLAVEDLGRLVAEGYITFPNLETVFGAPIAASDTTLGDFATQVGRDPDLLRRSIGASFDDDRFSAVLRLSRPGDKCLARTLQPASARPTVRGNDYNGGLKMVASRGRTL
jgi:hypothetical protein